MYIVRDQGDACSILFGKKEATDRTNIDGRREKQMHSMRSPPLKDVAEGELREKKWLTLNIGQALRRREEGASRGRGRGKSPPSNTKRKEGTFRKEKTLSPTCGSTRRFYELSLFGKSR